MTSVDDPRRWARCAWCRVTVPLEDAIEGGWAPDWWHGDECHDLPAGPGCAADHLEQDASGETALKPGHHVPVED